MDAFGNVQTNIGPEDLRAVGLSPGDMVTVKVGSTLHTLPWAAAYGDVAPGEPLIHVDSVGLLAIAVREGRADEELNLAEGMAISLAGRRSSTAG